jgi:hypothetical protein
MLIYKSTVGGLLSDIDADQLVEKIDAAFTVKNVGGVSPSERRAWRNSFQYVDRLLLRSDVPEDVGVAIEYKLPLTSNRVDLMLSGYDASGTAHIVVIELKQWSSENVEHVEGKDGLVKVQYKHGVDEGSDYEDDLGPVIEEADDLSQPLGEVWTDGLPAYRGMEHDHRYVVHDEGYVSDEGVHTNQAECLWSLLQPWLAKFRGLSKSRPWSRPLGPTASSGH